jgi:hypothetical protein
MMNDSNFQRDVAAICAEAAAILQAVAGSLDPNNLPESWRWPIIDELNGLAAAAHGLDPDPESGNSRLWNWFGLSYASWLAMPRVMMHSMPDEWQSKMADLCEEWDAAWDAGDMPKCRIFAVGPNGRMVAWPKWVLNYRHPDRYVINAIRNDNWTGWSPLMPSIGRAKPLVER